MEKTLYDMLDWAGIEELVYSESSDPHRLLGPHVTEQGIFVQALMPGARSVTICLANGKRYEMEDVDPGGMYQGVFAALIPRKTIPDYTYEVVYDNGATEERKDPYAFEPLFTENDLKKFGAGIHYSIYEKLGAHLTKIHNVEGVYFGVWGPRKTDLSHVVP